MNNEIEFEDESKIESILNKISDLITALDENLNINKNSDQLIKDAMADLRKGVFIIRNYIKN